jgi:hypothetical protein
MIQHPHDDIEALALGSLDEVSARRVLAHADECATCAVLVAQAMSAAAALEAEGERPLALPSRLGDIGGWASAARLPRFVPLQWVAGLAAVVIIGLLVWNLSLRSSMPTVPVASLVHSHFEHHALRGPIGDVKVIQALDGHWLYLLADGLPPRTRFDLFETSDGMQRRVGEFATTASGQATAYWEQAPTRIQALRVVSAATLAPTAHWP